MVVKTFLTALIAVSIPFMVWAVDMRVQQQMGTVVQQQMAVEQIEYLEHVKRTRALSEQERRDLEYYRSRLERIRNQ